MASLRLVGMRRSSAAGFKQRVAAPRSPANPRRLGRRAWAIVSTCARSTTSKPIRTACSTLARITPVVLACALVTAAPLLAADVQVVTSGTFRAAYLELVPEYEHVTSDKLVTGFGASMGTTHNAIPMRLDRGEVLDVVIMFAPA